MRARGFKVTYVRNFTDVDDKIIMRANELGKEPLVLAQENIDAFYEDMDRLAILRPDKEPRATEHIEHMIDMIKVLIEKGFAYVEGSDVYYSIERLPDYGSLSGRRIEDMKAGARIDVDERKRHPMDFALWKGAKPGEPWWDSPWGHGRPGWHMECSVMSNYYLGPTFDIHGGGKDLLFPHHENERAQSVAANGVEFARYWVHNGFVTVESDKMSKSLGNFITIRDALKEYPAEALRLFLLSKHYRSPLDFARKDVLNVQSGLIKIYRTLQRLESLIGKPESKCDSSMGCVFSGESEGDFIKQFLTFMDDDMNTAGAVGLIFEKVKEMNRLMDDHAGKSDETLLKRLADDRSGLLKASHILGILQTEPAEFLSSIQGDSDINSAEVERLIKERADARSNKDWGRADAVRKTLQEMGVIIEDTPRGTKWRRA
jgi:cysteinyl-tRNA synthetase